MTTPTLNLAKKKHAMGFLPSNYAPRCSNCLNLKDRYKAHDVPRCSHNEGGFTVSNGGWCPQWQPSDEWLSLAETRPTAEILEALEMVMWNPPDLPPDSEELILIDALSEDEIRLGYWVGDFYEDETGFVHKRLKAWAYLPKGHRRHTATEQPA
jgi:hypothetical protein